MQSHLSFNTCRDRVDKSFSLKEAEDVLEGTFTDGNMLYQWIRAPFTNCYCNISEVNISSES